jgi:serine/threonine-protein kinase RsbT
VLSVSELATNLVRYARDGYLILRRISNSRAEGVEIESRDSGPGIEQPLTRRHSDASTGGGLGAGLAGVQRLMHEFELKTGPTGTTVICRRWRSW